MTEHKKPEYDFLDVLGSSGLSRSGGQIDEEWLRQLQGEKGHRIYTEMRDNDPVVGAILYAIKTLVRQTKSQINPANEEPVAKQYAEFIESCIEDMSVTWPDFLAEVLSFLPFGWSFTKCAEAITRNQSSVATSKTAVSVGASLQFARRIPCSSGSSTKKAD